MGSAALLALFGVWPGQSELNELSRLVQCVPTPLANTLAPHQCESHFTRVPFACTGGGSHSLRWNTLAIPPPPRDSLFNSMFLT